MARPREFDTDKALDAAMQVFWERGYEGASLNDLLRAMGIARGSLYKAFKDKHSIYLATLDRYEATVVSRAIAMLTDEAGGDGVDRIRRLLETACAPVAQGDRRGCFLCNAAVDQAALDDQVRDKVLAMTQRLESAVATALSQSAAASDWSPVRRRETARLLTSAYMGLRVLARAGYPAAAIEAVIGASLEPLDQG